MDWKRQIYIYQKSRQTKGKLKLSWKWSTTCHRETALCPTAGKGKASGQVRPAGPRVTGWPRSVSAHQGIRLVELSEVSRTLELQHVLPSHRGRQKRNNSEPELAPSTCVRSAWSGEVNRDRRPLFESLPPSHSLVPQLTGEHIEVWCDGINSGLQQKLL